MSAQHGDEQNDGPLLRHCKDNQLYYLAKRIRINGELYGYVFMLQKEENFSTYCGCAVIHQLCATEFMLKKHQCGQRETGYMAICLLIFSAVYRREQINARIYAEMKFPNCMCIAAVKAAVFREQTMSRTICRVLCGRCSRARDIYYNKMMVILFGLSDDAPALAEET